MVIISASDANTAADVAKESITSLPGMIPQYYNDLKVIVRKDCKQNVCLTLWKLYKNDRSLIICAMGVLMNYGILTATLGTKDRLIFRSAVTTPDSPFLTIRRATHTRVATMTIYRRLIERNVRSYRPIRHLPFTPAHYGARLRWCLAPSGWNSVY
ncbi:HTH_Tnp_Tc3_2 domain-containing protein [Trichonephila clavipes]|nr:HTH_Tnp_Tc3_2 domain-containing protein [Trichonephila clavipes]